MLKLGLYEQVVNEMIAAELAALSGAWEADVQRMDEAESAKVLGLYLGRLLTQVLEYIDGVEGQKVADRVTFCNEVIRYAAGLLEGGGFGGRLDAALAERLRGASVGAEAQLLLEVADARRLPARGRAEREAARPATSLAMSSLFTGDKQEPSMMAELKKEIGTSDRIDFLVSFVKYSGLRLLLEELRAFTARGGSLRVITTCYMGATDYKAVEQLAAMPNTEVKISYDTRTTRLHAKSYMFYRDTGFSTLYIGSSNMSEAAMTSGLEWNVKLSAQDAEDIFAKVDVTFEHYWNSAEFVTFVPALHAGELRRALRSERAGGEAEAPLGDGAFFFDVQPYYYQQEILDKLEAERELRGHWRNLVVAATGTGKTVISAFDYRSFRQGAPRARLLFVAHRKEILSQSLACFRSILRDLNFGDMLVGGETPASLDHLFVSIQSFNSQDLIARTPPDYYDFIVVDEFHHAAAPSYQALLGYYTPQVLLGLTATPERADGKSVLDYFGGRVAAEMRLYEAIERKLLSPFHYFGVTDSVDLREVGWKYGKYDEAELENVFVLDAFRAKQRAQFIYEAVERYCTDVRDVVGIGFCVSKRHAEFMAAQFNAMGVPSEYLVAESADEIRDGVKGRLVRREINFVFVVDLYNEGVDIPEVNTVLFLRPTESLTVYLQQLGRGLRLCEGKEALTVLDFVGHARREYNFEDRFKALLPRNRQSVVREMENHFPNVPRGCSIILEKQAQEIVLAHIKSSVNNLRNLRRKVRDFFTAQPDARVGEFFEGYHVEPVELYGVE
ncbi:DEAD/DEAH box helicase family protein [Paenibacillus sp. TRM 82003]|nr:DEAD/DEAH box helicase family protein [Paenibacillus sp. TRM 82003]